MNSNLRRYLPVLRYALYDAGNSNYATLVSAVVFPVYFVSAFSRDSKLGDLVFGGLIVLATILSGLLGPWLGARADRRSGKFALLRGLSILTILGTAAMALLPGQARLAACALFVLTQTGFLLATVLYDSALSDVSSREEAADVSSFAWGVGYFGGIIGLVLATFTGGSDTARYNQSFLIAAGLFAALGLPLMLKRDARRPPSAAAPTPDKPHPVREFMRDPLRRRLFLAYFLYSNGVSAVIYFTGLYAKDTLGYRFDQLLWLFVAMNAVAAPAAIVFGKIAGRFGQMRTLKFVVGAWVVAVIAVALADKRSFVVVACAAAALLGPVQALSRSLFRTIFPDEAMSSYFGVQALASRCSALVGPLLFGGATYLTGHRQFGALSAGMLFAAGLAVLWRVPSRTGDCR